jgi:hypothetical protein
LFPVTPSELELARKPERAVANEKGMILSP